jgi:hypothetical protein
MLLAALGEEDERGAAGKGARPVNEQPRMAPGAIHCSNESN